MTSPHNICSRCVMDRSATEIEFNHDGICNFCTQAKKALIECQVNQSVKNRLFEKICNSGVEYNCLIGLSGGVDSSFALHLAVRMGLKPLCFSVDNGWNDPRADENIMRLVEGLGVPFYRYTINLPEFRELQSAFFKAGVKNVEIPTDHVLMATSLEMAAKHNIKYIISGGNVATESIMPPSWGYSARDLVHIKDIYRRFGGGNLSVLPTCSLLKWNYYRWVRGIKTVYLLDYVNYIREEAIQVLEKEYGYRPYGEKHCESVFTAWFQNYYLFHKFGIDKRKAHLSSMIVSDQMTRESALQELEKSPVYPELGIEKKVLKYARHEHEEYLIDKWYGRIANFLRLWRS